MTQLWNAKVDFSESLMTGEVRGIEIAFNVRPCNLNSPLRTCRNVLQSRQNFFTTVKALVSQAEAEGPKLDGKNRFGQAERELTDR